MPSASRKRRAGAADEVEDIHLREHVYRIATADQYYDAMKRIRHARYAMDSLLDGSRVYGEADGVDSLLDEARAIRPRFEALEAKAAPLNRVDGRLVREERSMEPEDFCSRTQDQIELWQEAEDAIARIYELMAGSLEQHLVSHDQEVPELKILVSLMQFHGSKRMDDSPPYRTYIFDLGFGDPFEATFADYEPRRRRAERWYDQALEAMASYVDASRRQKESELLVRLTWTMTVLTIVIAILTAGTLWAAFAPR